MAALVAAYPGSDQIAPKSFDNLFYKHLGSGLHETWRSVTGSSIPRSNPCFQKCEHIIANVPSRLGPKLRLVSLKWPDNYAEF